ncbi:hypothetical protein ES332_A01G217000v1 [Gossypium tomentosum]|uniref:DUF7792 domain-containing protein n=1 Tax=Gossypium tomentosum TaxID=34277 RepID=A0A5D2RUL0_GOSTO|nr:hypothetical protein ES332_A01G217000v1 [Gossypium tomentosum]
MLSWEARTQIQQLWDLISLGDDVCTSANKAKSFKKEVSELESLVNRLSQMLKTLLCFVTSTHTSLYLRPLHCIVAEVKVGFEHALSIVHKCKRGNLFWKLFTTCSNATQFVELFNCLNASISDMKWLLSIYMPQSCSTPTYEKPVKVKVWSCIAAVKMGRALEDRVLAVKQLASLAEQNDEYKNIIYEENGVPSLQKLLKEKISLDAQIMGVKTLCLLANEKERKRVILKEMISTILSRSSRTSAMSDQIQAANLLVTLLSPADDTKSNPKLKLSCSRALWMLVQGSISNCKTLTKTKGMLCLAKLMKTEKNELQYNCLMIIREITAIAESNNEFRHSTFKSSSPAAKAVVDELLKVSKEFDNMKLRIPVIKSVGSLARSFSTKECQVIIAMEASIALQKFINPNNYLFCEHSKSIIESNGVPLLIKLLLDDGDKKLQCHRLTLICYLANHDSNSNVLIKGALTALQTTAPTIMAQHPELKQLVSQAICKLQSNKADKHQELENSRGIKWFITEQGKAVVDLVRGLKLKLESECVGGRVKIQLQGYWKSYKKKISGAIRSLRMRRRWRLVKAKSVELALTLRSVIEYSGKRVIMKEMVSKLRVVKRIVKSKDKKEIRRKFGFIIHKIFISVISICYSLT